MSLVEQQGALELETAQGRLRLLQAAPLIAPARQYVFPQQVPGEEEALSRGSVYVDTMTTSGSFLAQCAIGFSGAGVAHGLWTSPVTGTALVAAGGYIYLLQLERPRQTLLLPIRPATGVVSGAESGHVVLVGYHHVLVLGPDGQQWQSERISWEGITVLSLQGGILSGTGWNMLDDVEVPFSLDLRSRKLTGGGYSGPRS